MGKKKKGDDKIVLKKGDEFTEELSMTVAEIVEAIEKLNAAMKALENSRMKHKTILILLSHHTRMTQNDCDLVLNGLVNLKRYLK